MEHYSNLSILNISGEIWKDVCGYEKIYQVSNYGRIKSMSRKTRESHRYGNVFSKDMIIKQRKDKNGYLIVTLNKDKKIKTFKSHRLVAIAFIPNPDNKEQVNHKKGIKTNNMVSELEWSTNSENQKHRYKVLKNSGVNLGRFGIKNKLSIKIIQYDLNFKYIKKWNCVSDVKRVLGLCPSGIIKVCKKKQSNCGGFIWRYYKYKSKKSQIKSNNNKIKNIKDINGEIWSNILGYEGKYMVSNFGRVKSLSREVNNIKYVYVINNKILKQHKDVNGYLNIVLKNNGVCKTYKIHRLVAKSFVKNHENKTQVNHINGIKSDNRFVNLEWCSPSENQKHNFKVLKYKGNNIGNLGIKNKLSKVVYQYNLKGKLVKKWDSLSDIGRDIGLNTSIISKVCRGVYVSNVYSGFIWKYI